MAVVAYVYLAQKNEHQFCYISKRLKNNLAQHFERDTKQMSSYLPHECVVVVGFNLAGVN